MLLLSDSCHDCITVETIRETLGLGSRVVLNPVGLKKGSFSELTQRIFVAVYGFVQRRH